LNANVDYGVATAITKYGTIGIKVWIYKGIFGEETEQGVRRRPTRPVTMGPPEKDVHRGAAVRDSKGPAHAKTAAPPPASDAGGPQPTGGS
jgi:ribosomal protein S3